MTDETTSIILFAVITTLLILILVGFLFAVIVLYRRKQSIYTKTLQNVQLEHQKKILETQLQIQEETSQNISREIHDNINQVLSLAKFKLSTLSDDIVTPHKALIEIESLIGEAIHDLKDISRSLSSDLIKRNGLIKTIEFEIERLAPTKNTIDFSATGEDIFLDTDSKLILFRIIQEALSNTIKHANPTKITVEINSSKESVRVSLIDDGKGFDPVVTEKAQDEKSGLLNMKKRTELLRGEFRLESQLNQGTRIEITIPTQN